MQTGKSCNNACTVKNINCKLQFKHSVACVPAHVPACDVNNAHSRWHRLGLHLHAAAGSCMRELCIACQTYPTPIYKHTACQTIVYCVSYLPGCSVLSRHLCLEMVEFIRLMLLMVPLDGDRDSNQQLKAVAETNLRLFTSRTR